MGLPTLLRKGSLVSLTNDPVEKKVLDEVIPIDYVINWFKQRISKIGITNRVLILKSETASGKSTLFPPELYKAMIMGKPEPIAGIICTQPRVVTTIENVNEMLKHYSKQLRLGKNIGWNTRYNKFSMNTAGLLSATIGTLAQQLRSMSDEEILARYKYILIDETHERDLQTDLTIYMLKNLLVRNAQNINCPFVVLMSATFDPHAFLKYFGVSNENFIWCRGEAAGFTEMWDWNEDRTVNNYCQAAANIVEKIVYENAQDDPAKADILIFMPGIAEFKNTVQFLTALNKKLALDGKTVFSLLQIDSAAQQKQTRDYRWTMYTPVGDHEIIIDGKKYIPGRRVIISTNVAETGLTLDNLKYVIDSGYNREIEYNPIHGIRGLITKPAPKSRIRQRKGRAGRKFPGVFYPLYPQYIYNKLPDLQLPQILIEDISILVLDIINEQLKSKSLISNNVEFDINDIDMVDVPTPDALLTSIEKLYAIGLISPIAPAWNIDKKIILESAPINKFSITHLGVLASLFGLISPEASRMVLSAYYWGASVLDMITIAAYISVDARYFIAESAEGRKKINWNNVYKTALPMIITNNTKLLTADEFIDGLVLFNGVKNIISKCELKNMQAALSTWCDENHISYRAIIDLIKVRDELIEHLIGEGFDLFINEGEAIVKASPDNFMNTITKIKYCIYDGYRNNLIISDNGNYLTGTGLSVLKPKLFTSANNKPWSTYAETNANPRYMIYKELTLKYNNATFAYDVAANTVSICDGFVNVDAGFIK